jgi:hypothetical protein
MNEKLLIALIYTPSIIIWSIVLILYGNEYLSDKTNKLARNFTLISILVLIYFFSVIIFQ